MPRFQTEPVPVTVTVFPSVALVEAWAIYCAAAPVNSLPPDATSRLFDAAPSAATWSATFVTTAPSSIVSALLNSAGPEDRAEDVAVCVRSRVPGPVMVIVLLEPRMVR